MTKGQKEVYKKKSNIARKDYKVIFFVFGTPVELAAGNRGMRNGESLYLKVFFFKTTFFLFLALMDRFFGIIFPLIKYHKRLISHHSL